MQANAGIEHRVADVDEQVGQDHGCRGDQDAETLLLNTEPGRPHDTTPA
jgi:hypothetical protein